MVLPNKYTYPENGLDMPFYVCSSYKVIDVLTLTYVTHLKKQLHCTIDLGSAKYVIKLSWRSIFMLFLYFDVVGGFIAKKRSNIVLRLYMS